MRSKDELGELQLPIDPETMDQAEIESKILAAIRTGAAAGQAKIHIKYDHTKHSKVHIVIGE